MTESVAAFVVVIVILEIKHFIFDYPLQTAYQLDNKGTYGHPGGIIHAGAHALGTSTAFLAVTPSLAIGAAIMVGEFLVHYHVDWTKENLMRWSGMKVNDRGFWWGIGADQLVHHLTYVAIAAVLVTFAA